ncbi:MAG TPA: uroporphyrinogen decarboxylase [Candidatus Saccharimonadales bacterium]|nr:uroporphyrinogen decarboxylase [Candidatus Saccharimonadales bacterium]
MNTTFIDACFGKKTTYTPVWYMRQAGRYLPEYHKLKGKKNILDIIQTPEIAAQIALQPVNSLGVDAVILYADIMIPLLGAGVDLKIVENIGPVIKYPVRTLRDVQNIRRLQPIEDIPYLFKTINIVKGELADRAPLIGFSAAPFTLASYLIEGQPSRTFIFTKTFMYTQPDTWHHLMKKLSEMIITYLLSQVEAGIDAIQLFDSWVGCLSDEDYKEFVLPYTSHIFKSLKNKKIPTIHFATNTAAIFDSFASVDCDVISVDWRMPLAATWKELNYKKAIQGNLDPALLMADWPFIKKRVDEIFTSLPRTNGYIFNLGHGVMPSTPVETLKKLTDYIHSKS